MRQDLWVLTAIRVVGLVVMLAGLALLRRERNLASELHRSMRPSWIAADVAVTLAGVALATWAILAA